MCHGFRVTKRDDKSLLTTFEARIIFKTAGAIGKNYFSLNQTTISKFYQVKLVQISDTQFKTDQESSAILILRLW